MAFKGNKKKNKALSPRRLPTKRTINLAVVGEKPLNLLVAVPAILVILVAAGLLSKFAVADRLTAVSRVQAEGASLQASQTIPFRMVRLSFRGRPCLPVFSGGSKGAMRFHSSLVGSYHLNIMDTPLPLFYHDEGYRTIFYFSNAA